MYTSLFKSLLNVKGACVKPLLQVQPDAAVFNALISACARGGHWAGAKTQKETLYIHPPCFRCPGGRVRSTHTQRANKTKLRATLYTTPLAFGSQVGLVRVVPLAPKTLRRHGRARAMEHTL